MDVPSRQSDSLADWLTYLEALHPKTIEMGLERVNQVRLPQINGTFNPAEWPNQPLIKFAPENNPSDLVQVYFVRDGANLYMAFLINDPTTDATDSLRLYFDTTGNRGDPDTADRFFFVVRDGTQVVQAGIGSNSDGNIWDTNYTSSNWTAEIGGQAGQWVIEMQIDAAAELAALGNPFGMMVQVLFTGNLATWPAGGGSNSPSSWQFVNNVSCPRKMPKRPAGPCQPNWLKSQAVEAMALADEDVRRALLAHFTRAAIDFVRERLGGYRKRARHLGFDDLIGQLHASLHGDSATHLAEAIASEVPALLVDEFQDTDPLEYAILHRIHMARADAVLLLIGDPKQAIYRFRGGDIYTYHAAARDAGSNLHTLRDNWRSDARLIEAVNAVFGGVTDPFMVDFIGFQPAQYPSTKNKPESWLKSDSPLTLWRLTGDAE